MSTQVFLQQETFVLTFPVVFISQLKNLYSFVCQGQWTMLKSQARFNLLG